MGLDLVKNSTNQIVATLAEEKEGLKILLNAISVTEVWDDEKERNLDSVYRTRMRHLFAPRLHLNSLVEFSEHLNIAASIVRYECPLLAEKIDIYEALVNDAIGEIEVGWLDEVIRKKYVIQILEQLSYAPHDEFSSHDLHKLLKVDPDDIKNKLGIMESVGLVSRRYEGDILYAQLTNLGHKHALSTNTRNDRILNIGVTGRGLYINKSGSDNSCVLYHDNCNLILSDEAYPSYENVIPKNRLKHFGLYPIAYKIGTYKLYVALSGPEEQIILGSWDNDAAFQSILDWVSNANNLISDTSKIDTDGVRLRIYDRSHLNWVPGQSMTASTITAMGGIYDKNWMSETVGLLCRYLNDGINEDGIANLRRISPKKMPWPATLNWEYMFDLISSPQSYKQEALEKSIDLCFEFLYQDPVRFGKYDLIKIGKLKSFKFLLHRGNEKFDKLFSVISENSDLEKENGNDQDPDEALLLNANPMPYSEFISILASVGGVKPKKTPAWEFCTCKATVCNNIMRDLCGSDYIKSRYWNEYDNTAKFIELFNKKHKTAVMLCDNVLANDFLAQWKLRYADEADQIAIVQVEYPWQVDVGIGVPDKQPEWKSLLYSALYKAINGAGRESWIQTLEDLHRIDVEVDESFIPKSEPMKDGVDDSFILKS